MIRRYAELGYDFLMISDHDGVTDIGGLDPHGMVLLPGNEIWGGGPHVLDVGARKRMGWGGWLQPMLDAINSESGFPVLAHPNWGEDFNHFPIQELLALTNYAGIEIYNGTCLHSSGSHLALDKWDLLLSAGRKVWGYAGDDAHMAIHAGLGWNVVRARSRTPEAILEALRSGSFYASCGVRIEEIRCEGSVVTVRAPNAQRMAVVGRFGARIHAVEGSNLRFDTADVMQPYIRIECHGAAEQAAWTQPLMIRDGKYEVFHRQLAALGAGAKSSLQALASDRPPVLTGKADDPLWRQAPLHDRFLDIGSGQPAPVRNALRCIRSGNTLYFALRGEEPLLGRVPLAASRTGNLFADDSMEVFLDFDGQGASYCQILASASARTTADWRGRGPAQATVGPLAAKSATWEEGGTRGWTVELAVPVTGRDLQPGRRIGFHVCRNRTPEPAFYVWSWIGNNNHCPKDFGTLIL